MILNRTFDHIYVLNLEESVDRKEHIIKEFNRVGINEYEFFKASHYNSDEVKEMYKSDFVKKFPNCFRCKFNRCSCENNFLTLFQVANWCSFLRIFKDIIKKQYKFVLICEDDIVFSIQSKKIVEQLLSPENFKKYKINMNIPLLIRMGTAFNVNNHHANAIPIFKKSFTTCNPCFAINYSMAKLYLDNLKMIYHTSDVYFHVDIPKIFGNRIQAYSMFPFPIYELSFVKSIQKFDSLIRPSNQLRRIEFKDFLFLTFNPFLQLFLKKITGYHNLDINYNVFSYHGNINTFLLLNEDDKKKYYFQHRFFIYDDIYTDIKLIYYFVQNKTNLELYNKYIIKINYIFKTNIECKDDLEMIVLFYIHFKKLCEMENPEIIEINKLQEKNIFSKKIIERCMNDYKKYTETILVNICIENKDIDLFLDKS